MMPISRLFQTTLVYLLGALFSPVLATEEQCSLPPKPLFLRVGNCSIPPSQDYPYEVNAWGLLVNIASQDLCLGPSFVVNNTVIMATEICTVNNENLSTLPQCISRRGGVLNENKTTNFVITSQGDLAPDPVWDSFNPPFAEAANTTIQLASDISLPSYPIALAFSGQNSSVGQLGLANSSVFLHELVNAGLSSVAGFSLLLGSQNVLNPREGHLVVGGYDAASLAGPFYNYSMSNTTTAGSRVCSMQIEIEELTLSRPGVDDVVLVSPGTPMTSCLEALDDMFRFPRDVLNEFQQNTNWHDDISVPSSLYIVERGLFYNSSFDGTLKFSLKDGPVIEIPNEELAQPLRGIDPTGQRVLQSNVTVVNIFDQDAPEGTAVLGKVFLSQVYLTVNYALRQFQIAPAVTQGVAALDLVPLVDPSSINCPLGPHDKADDGVIVEGCVLAVVLIILIILGVYLREQNKARPPAPNDIPGQVNPPGDRPPVRIIPQGRLELPTPQAETTIMEMNVPRTSDATGLDPVRKISDAITVSSGTPSKPVSPIHTAKELPGTSETE